MQDISFEKLAPEYEADLASMKLTRTHDAAVRAKQLLEHRDRFLALQKLSGVPALWVIPVFDREGPWFSLYLGNGDNLDAPTTHVPRGRGPFDTWEAGAADALTLDRITLVTEWTWARACFEWESWNGWGPRIYHGRPSGYVWSGTSIYGGGKYVADGVWSRGTWDHQLGTVALAKAIAALDSEIGKGFDPPTTS